MKSAHRAAAMHASLPAGAWLPPGAGTSTTSLSVVDTGSNTPPVSGDCVGDITIRFSQVDHVLDFTGTRNGDLLVATFSGRTPQVGNLVIDWDGGFTAQRPWGASGRGHRGRVLMPLPLRGRGSSGVACLVRRELAEPRWCSLHVRTH